MEHTIDSLTDEQIDQLRNEAIDADDSRTADQCTAALSTAAAVRNSARRWIARHLNAVEAAQLGKLEVTP